MQNSTPPLFYHFPLFNKYMSNLVIATMKFYRLCHHFTNSLSFTNFLLQELGILSASQSFIKTPTIGIKDRIWTIEKTLSILLQMFHWKKFASRYLFPKLFLKVKGITDILFKIFLADLYKSCKRDIFPLFIVSLQIF